MINIRVMTILTILLFICTTLCVGSNNIDLFEIMPTINKYKSNNQQFAITPVANKKVGSHSYVVRGKRYQTLSSSSIKKFTQTGIASWYGPGFHGKRTANGEIYNQNAMTAAHKTLPLSTVVKVTNLENKKSIIVRINDRGPYYGNRILDLSKKAAEMLGVSKRGTAKIKLEVVT